MCALPRKPRSVSPCAIAWKRLRGPGAPLARSYSETAPHRATRPPRRSAPSAASRCAAADVVEVDVDAVGRGGAQRRRDRRRAVVERRVEPELVAQVRDLRGGPGAPDHAVPAQLCQLGGEAPDGARRGGHPDDVAAAQLRGGEEPGVGRQAHPAERAQVPLGRRERRVQARERAEAAERGLVRADDGVVAPAGRVPDGVAGREPVRARGDDHAHGHDPVHRGPERKGREVAGGARRAQAHAKAGINRCPRVAHEDLARSGLAHRHGDDVEVVWAQLVARMRHGLDLAAHEPADLAAAVSPLV